MQLLPETGFPQTADFYVYELIGDDSKPFYVGRTSDPQRRLAQHLSPTCSHGNPAHVMLMSQKKPRMRIVGKYSTLSAAASAEKRRIIMTPGLVNKPIGKKVKIQNPSFKVRLTTDARQILSKLCRSFEPNLERGSVLSAILTSVEEDILCAAAEEAIRRRGDMTIVRIIDNIPPDMVGDCDDES